jgi:chemotaxis protein CheD
MADKLVVGISDMKITRRPDVLVTYALGSCVGICLYDAIAGVAGMSHILLPEALACPRDTNPAKFADTAIEELVRQMHLHGAHRSRMTAKIAGGAQLFGTNTAPESMRIGDRNVRAVKQELERMRIRITGEDTGSNYGRTVEFESVNGVVRISSALKGVKTL